MNFNKILLITQREFISRVRQKSFIVMTFVGPILMAALIIVPVWFATLEDESEKTIAVIDKTGRFENVFSGNKNYTFVFIPDTPTDTVKSRFKNSGYEALLVIRDTTGIKSPILYSDKQASMNLKMFVTDKLESKIRENKLRKMGISQLQIDSAKASVNVETVKWNESGKEETSSAEVGLVLGFILAIVIYMFIFMYGAQVMRGVIEEKASRVVEVLISSVKPFELMAGKILGVALTAITQFILWIALTAVIAIPAQQIFLGEKIGNIQQTVEQQGFQAQSDKLPQGEITEMLSAVSNIDFIGLGAAFLFFFVFGYLLYAALFAAIGSAVDNEADTQQFMLPVTIPLILAFVAAQSIIRFPDGNIAFWFSIIPYTSPVIMPVRIASDAVSTWQIVLSGIVLVVFFIFHIWLAAKIYRTGILMYGKKPSYKELWKWIRHS